MRLSRTADLWWKNAVIYCLDVETFFDHDGNGYGDFQGLAQRVDYLADLGVTCIWLMPFYPTPDRDDGYDITDYYGVDPRLGSHGDLAEFLRLARDRGLRVIADLVINHTSDQHPWFQQARADRRSRYRDWYVWRDEISQEEQREPVFPDQEDGVWSFDDQAGQFYLHRFYHHQPDLNVANPAVRDEIARVIGFWLQLGISGFRVDAVPYFLETFAGMPDGDLPDPHAYLQDLRNVLNRREGEAVMLGEVNLPYDEVIDFFGDTDGDELTMCFDFVAMQHLYLALARQTPAPLVEVLQQRPSQPADAQWATFVRNHDELTLDKLDEDQRREVFAAFGPEPEMQLYDRGLRRRLPTMLGGDRDRIRMVYSLLFALPGTPVLFYGEEIGMGENLAARDRLAVRTPMQWSAGPTGGFSTADPDRLAAPVVTGDFGPDRVNVADQSRDPESLLSWMRLLIRRYRQCPELSWGDWRAVPSGADAVLAHRADCDGGTVITLHNFGEDPVEVTIPVEGAGEDHRLIDLLGNDEVRLDGDGTAAVRLGRYGCRWLRLLPPGENLLI